jgi:hypothetical protein
VAEEIRNHPNWVFPLLLSVVFSFLLAAALFSRPEWREALQKAALSGAPTNLGELEKVQLLKTLQVMAWVGAMAAVIIGNLLLALLLWGTVVLMEGRPRFLTIFSLQLHAQMVTVLPQALGLGILLARKGRDLNASDAFPISLAYFLPSQGGAPVLRGIATAVDLFTLWYWALVLVGLPIVAGLPRKKVLLPVLLFIFLGILVRAATISLALAGP